MRTSKNSNKLLISLRPVGLATVGFLFLGFSSWTVSAQNRGETEAKTRLAGSVAVPWTMAVESVTGKEIRRHMEVLADDDMEGRETGSPGYQRAADFVARQFETIGLSPLGDDGSYFQAIEFFETRLVPESATLRLKKGSNPLDLVFGDDFLRSGGFGTAEEKMTAPLVFVGHGITAPEYGHNDFADVSVAEKILVVLSGAPSHFATDQRAFYSSSQVKKARAIELGAVGIVTIRTPVDQKRRPWSLYLQRTNHVGMRWLDHGRAFEGYPNLAGSAILSEQGAEKLFALAEHDLTAVFEKHAAGEAGSFEMGFSATLGRTSKQGRIASANVVGLLEGSDPDLRDEYIVYTAHLDHLGTREGKENGEIYNGAYDNAAGVATILEIAEAMASLADAPRRSIVFATLTGEEKGLRGSSYFAHNSPIPIKQIVANLNIDMPYLGFPIGDVEAFGAEHSSLQRSVSRAAEALGLTLTPDSMPEQVRFVRSDQFSFVQVGIPALALKPGSKSSDISIDGAGKLSEFLQSHYHRTSDDLDLPYSSEGAERFGRIGLLTGLFIANDEERPRWNEGDFFGQKFGR